MSANTRLLMGEVIENPGTEEKNIELLLLNFLKALVEEQSRFNPFVNASSNDAVSSASQKLFTQIQEGL